MLRGPMRWVVRLVAWLVVVGVAAALVAAVLVPKFAGATPYTVMTGSMRPLLPPGTLVVTKPVDASDIGVGDVITFQRESGLDAVVTHRVVAAGINSLGETRFQTKGDANDTPDLEWVRPVQVRGEEWYSVRYLGYLGNMLEPTQRQVLVYLIAALLLAYAGYLVTSETPQRRPERSRS